MASFTTINGRPVIQIGRGKDRKTISLGGMNERNGRSVLAHIENILSSKASGAALPVTTAQWLRDCPAKLHAKLVKAKLAHPRTDRQTMALARYFESYIKRRTDLRPSTINNLTLTKLYAVKHFGETRDMRTITRGDVKTWHRAAQIDYAEATVAMMVKKMREVWRDAIDHKLLDENVFAAVKIGSFENPDRLVYIPRGTIQAIIDKTDDFEWKLIFALARFGGLRTPSEPLAMQREDIGDDRFVVRENKTERRTTPIFPSLRVLFDQLPAGPGPVFQRLSARTLRTQAVKLIKRAGFKPWVKLFQNLRASCETDLAQEHPLHVVVKWIGNSELIARKHYLQVTDGDFDRATKSAGPGAVPDSGRSQKEVPAMSEKPPSNANNSQTDCPRWEDGPPQISSEEQQANHEALYGALHPSLRNPKFKGEPNLDEAFSKIRRAVKGGGR